MPRLDPDTVADLATRTRAYRACDLATTEWDRAPGFEEVRVGILTELRYLP